MKVVISELVEWRTGERKRREDISRERRAEGNQVHPDPVSSNRAWHT